MTIRPIKYLNNYCCFSHSSISESTRRKLIALGIDPSTVHSESEAQAIIERILELRKNANIPNTFEKEKSKISNKTETQTLINSEKMMSMLNYDSNLKRIILGL